VRGAAAAGPCRLGVLASGRGSNLEAIIDATRDAGFPARVAIVVSDREGSGALERARRHQIPAVFLDPKAHGSREAWETALVEILADRAVDLVCLAGFMRVLTAGFVRRFAGRILNVHPSLLPAFPGLRAPRQALEHGVKVAGATVHFVDEGVDTGPIVLQACVPVLADDTEDALAARILDEEHRIYPASIRLVAEGRVTVSGRRAVVRESTR
jgi:phosphoribosylglycinamide formyltransferase-1